MKILNLKANMRTFADDTSGNFAIIMTIALVPVLLSVGIAVDYSNVQRHRVFLQQALDAASLAAAVSDNLTVAERIKLGEDTFESNIQNSELSELNIQPVFSVNSSTVTAALSHNYKLHFGPIAIREFWPMQMSNTVKFKVASEAEVALVLDYSSSMNSQGKWQAMRNAGLALVDTLSEGGTNPKIKFGLVPFAKLVHVSLDESYVVPEAKTGTGNGTWSISDGIWTGCTQDRKWPHNITEATPNTTNENTMWGLTPTASGTCHQMDNHNLSVLPLTNNHAAVNSQLNAMDPFVGTHIALGLEFGWHLISPNPPYSQGVAYDTAGVKKFIVLLTDGEQTTKAWGPGESLNQANGRDNIEDMCQDIKGKGIVIVTVAFDLNDGATKDRLKNCASAIEYFFDAEDNDDLSDAFGSVATIIQGSTHLSH